MLILGQAARRLGLAPMFVKGVCVGLGLKLRLVDQMIVITERDFGRLERHLKGTSYPVAKVGRKRKQPRPQEQASAATS